MSTVYPPYKQKAHHRIHDLGATNFGLMNNHRQKRFSFLNGHENHKIEIYLWLKLV